ncbi:hypothetical protein [Undibacterium sp. Jales W-56]|nr:hypothetical protein [Undibacterium sp. Jales W-56]
MNSEMARCGCFQPFQDHGALFYQVKDKISKNPQINGIFADFI